MRKNADCPTCGKGVRRFNSEDYETKPVMALMCHTIKDTNTVMWGIESVHPRHKCVTSHTERIRNDKTE